MAETYTTGVPCKRGHICPRYVKGGICVDCSRELCAAWRKQNRLKRRGYNAKWVASHPEKEREMRAAYRRANKHIERRRTLAWSIANRERKRELDANWTRNNPVANVARNARRRALKAKAPGRGVKNSDWQATLSNSVGLCVYCSLSAPLTMDHIEPLSRGGGHDPDNLAAACKSCNSAKGDAPLLLWLATRALTRNS